MRSYFFGAACAVALLLAACSPKGTVIPPDPNHWDQLSDKAKQLSPEDRRLFASYMARQAIGGALGGKPTIPEGTTIGKAIDEQRKFETDQANQQTQDAILKAKASAARAAEEAKLNSAALVTVVSKTYLPQNIQAERFSDRAEFVIAMQNKTAKDIAGIKGSMEFDDMFGTVIKSINFSFDDAVPAGQVHTSSNYYVDLNQFEAADQQLGQTDLSKMKVTFHPEMIVFADGTKMTTPTETDSAP